jgi:alkylhydroperoxidase family enzyme
MARIPDATTETFPEELRYVWERLASDTTAGTGEDHANIFKAMGNNPNILRGYLRLANPLWAYCGLDVKTRELVILRAAYIQDSAYEWHQHVRIGRQAGLTDAQMDGLRNWQDSDLFSPSERALFAYTDALAVSNHPGQLVFDALAKHFDKAAVVGITILVAFYFATAKFLGALEVDTEEEFSGWKVGT